ncbi:MAG: hypothetical protein AB1510_02360 [Bacillota bacterium]
MKIVVNRKPALIAAVVLVIVMLFVSAVYAQSSTSVLKDGKWVAGDFHTHTYLTDGSNTQKEVVDQAFHYGLDWMANSEHGGLSARDPEGNAFPYALWRWITLRDYSFPIIEDLRVQHPDKLLVQGLEWNVPTHEHASVGIVADEPTAISDFEYIFDAADNDNSRSSEGLEKKNVTHADAVAGAKWLQDNYPDASYFLINHPSRKLKFSVADIRDFNNAAPDVCFGFEGLPGHQKEAGRGGYDNDLGDNTYKARTYGGADYMVAKVGGLWDALLGEGRKFWIFVNSDFHKTTNDFWPGEYAKSYTWVSDNSYDSLIDGLRSGNSFAVQGDLINELDFNIKSRGKVAVMGQTMTVNKGDNAQITIRFKSPAANNNGDIPQVDHIDLIAGNVTGKAEPGTTAYNRDTNETARVVAKFSSDDWEVCDNGWCVVKYNLKKVQKDQYFRLRGTNLGAGVENETDADGNPLCDDLMGVNDASKAYEDLWFYSNPIFVKVQ